MTSFECVQEGTKLICNEITKTVPDFFSLPSLFYKLGLILILIIFLYLALSLINIFEEYSQPFKKL